MLVVCQGNLVQLQSRSFDAGGGVSGMGLVLTKPSGPVPIRDDIGGRSRSATSDVIIGSGVCGISVATR